VNVACEQRRRKEEGGRRKEEGGRRKVYVCAFSSNNMYECIQVAREM
jgi:hypothetical protein